MAHWIVVTDNTPAIKTAMNGFTGANLVRSGQNGKYIVWEWQNAADTDVQTLQASGHGQVLPFVPLCMIKADFLV